jgi:hypothetical protein
MKTKIKHLKNDHTSKKLCCGQKAWWDIPMGLTEAHRKQAGT